MKNTILQWVEFREDDVLVIHRPQIGPNDLAMVVLVSIYSLLLAVVALLARLPHINWTQIPVALVCLLVGQVLAIFLYRRARRGVWIIDDHGIEFRSRRGETTCILWKHMQWVMWGQSSVVLLGEGRRITLDRGVIVESDWKRVRERVERLLSGRFDLGLKVQPEQELNWLRVLSLAVPLVLLSSLLMFSLPLFQPRQQAALVLGFVGLLLGTMLWCGVGLYQESQAQPYLESPQESPECLGRLVGQSGSFRTRGEPPFAFLLDSLRVR